MKKYTHSVFCGLLLAVCTLFLSKESKAFTYNLSWPSCEKPILLLPDSLYPVLGSIPFSISLTQFDQFDNETVLLSASGILLSDSAYFTNLGTVSLSGMWPVVQFISSLIPSITQEVLTGCTGDRFIQ